MRSMTGFGRSELKTKHGLFVVEIRTLNHKFLEATLKLPESASIFDEKIKEVIKSKLKRGKAYLNLSHETGLATSENVFIDEKVAKSYFNKLNKLKKKLHAKESVTMHDIISFPGVVNYKLTHKSVTKLWPFMKEAVEKSLDKLVKDREKEGNALSRDLAKRAKRIEKIVVSIRKNTNSNVQSYKAKLAKRVKELSGGHSMDKGRLEQEVALYAKNSDITEEIIRIGSHIKNFSETMKKPGEIGKKLDFIAQELHREANTAGSKSSDFKVSKGVIEIKTEIEKIREQLKNIE